MTKVAKFREMTKGTAEDYIPIAVSYTHLRAHETREDLVWAVIR